jgi:hypothetical protein
MTFKQRYLEEAVDWGSIKEKLKPYTPALLGVGGAGAGALYNYLSGGADDLQQERAHELAQYLKSGSVEDLANKNLISKDDFTDLRDMYAIKNGYVGDYSSLLNHPFSSDPILAWVKGQSEDFHPLTDKNNAEIALQQWKMEHPDVKVEDIPAEYGGIVRNDAAVNGVKLNLSGNSDQDYERYVTNVKDRYFNMSPDERKEEILKHPELKEKYEGLQKDIKDSVKDSYVNKSALGAGLALGGYYGGKFAKRKLDEKKGY